MRSSLIGLLAVAAIATSCKKEDGTNTVIPISLSGINLPSSIEAGDGFEFNLSAKSNVSFKYARIKLATEQNKDVPYYEITYPTREASEEIFVKNDFPQTLNVLGKSVLTVNVMDNDGKEKELVHEFSVVDTQKPEVINYSLQKLASNSFQLSLTARDEYDVTKMVVIVNGVTAGGSSTELKKEIFDYTQKQRLATEIIPIGIAGAYSELKISIEITDSANNVYTEEKTESI